MKLSLNSRFATVNNVRKAQIEAGDVEASENTDSTASTTLGSDLEASESDTEEGDCIIVAVREVGQ